MCTIYKNSVRTSHGTKFVSIHVKPVNNLRYLKSLYGYSAVFLNATENGIYSYH